MDPEARAELARLKEKVERLEEDQRDMNKRDRDRMRTAVLMLGGIVMSMGTYIWTTFVGGKTP